MTVALQALRNWIVDQVARATDHSSEVKLLLLAAGMVILNVIYTDLIFGIDMDPQLVVYKTIGDSTLFIVIGYICHLQASPTLNRSLTILKTICQVTAFYFIDSVAVIILILVSDAFLGFILDNCIWILYVLSWLATSMLTPTPSRRDNLLRAVLQSIFLVEIMQYSFYSLHFVVVNVCLSLPMMVIHHPSLALIVVYATSLSCECLAYICGCAIMAYNEEIKTTSLLLGIAKIYTALPLIGHWIYNLDPVVGMISFISFTVATVFALEVGASMAGSSSKYWEFHAVRMDTRTINIILFMRTLGLYAPYCSCGY